VKTIVDGSDLALLRQRFNGNRKIMKQLENFKFEGKKESVSFIETLHVTDGVDCDVYAFVNDKEKDLGIIRIRPGYRTPLQKVLKGDRTIEGSISGSGKLTVIKSNGKRVIFKTEKEPKRPIVVNIGIGDVMQWEADKESTLVAFEICFPPYKEGRYENLN